MNPLAKRAIALFVSPAAPVAEPAAPVAEPAAWEPPTAVPASPGDDTGPCCGAIPDQVPRAGTVVVLGPPGPAAPVGAALAGELRCRARARTALLIVWAPSQIDPVASAPAWPAARRLAERLEAIEPPAVALGRLVRVDLPPEPEAAAARLPELIAVGEPAVLVLAGPRPAAFDPVLAAAELVVLVADPDHPPTVTAFAAEQLGHMGSAVTVQSPLGGAVARAVAGAGLARLRRLPAAPEATDT